MPEGREAPPHALIFVGMIVAVLAIDVTIRDRLLTKYIPKIVISRSDLLLLPLLLILLIRLASSEAFLSLLDFLSGVSPGAIHRFGGSPFGILCVVLVIVLLLNQSLFFPYPGKKDDDD